MFTPEISRRHAGTEEEEMAKIMDGATDLDKATTVTFRGSDDKPSWTKFGQKALLSLLAAGIAYLAVGAAIGATVPR